MQLIFHTANLQLRWPFSFKTNFILKLIWSPLIMKSVSVLKSVQFHRAEFDWELAMLVLLILFFSFFAADIIVVSNITYRGGQLFLTWRDT